MKKIMFLMLLVILSLAATAQNNGYDPEVEKFDLFAKPLIEPIPEINDEYREDKTKLPGDD